MSEILVKCLVEKLDPTYPLDGHHFYENQIYEAHYCNNLWFVRDHKHNRFITDEATFSNYFKPISDNLFSYKLWSAHHFYAQAKRIASKVGIKCECSPGEIQLIALGKSNPVKIHHSLIVHIVWKCSNCGKGIPLEVDLDKKTIQPFQELRMEDA